MDPLRFGVRVRVADRELWHLHLLRTPKLLLIIKSVYALLIDPFVGMRLP